ncbi:MAG TPA: hypothetical protein VL947_09500 [Cytophagales bacterium]|nr:hypothetical protein [Cytophagales bacterium]
MDIKSLLSEVDGLLQKGKFVDAAKKFFAEDIETINEHNHPINGKEAKIASLNDMHAHIKKVHSVKLLNQVVADKNTTYSEFNYHYEYNSGAQQTYGEVIKRQWDENGKIVSEKYYIGAIEPEKSNGRSSAKAESTTKKAEPKAAAAKKEVATKEPAKKPAAKATPAKSSTAKATATAAKKK